MKTRHTEFRTVYEHGFCTFGAVKPAGLGAAYCRSAGGHDGLVVSGRGRSAATEDDFLPPEQAFRFAARQLDPQTIEVRFDVASGYYLYRERFAFAVQPDTVRLGQPEFPHGKVKFDETFGKEMETYRDAVVIRVPVQSAPADGKWSLVVTSQGCADKGLCYPPMESVFKVGGSALGNLFGGSPRSEARVPPAASAGPGTEALAPQPASTRTTASPAYWPAATLASWPRFSSGWACC